MLAILAGDCVPRNMTARRTTMITVRIKADVQADRRVVLELPPEVPTGPAELVVTVDSHHASRNGEADQKREAALGQFLALARASSFRSVGSYPTRDELHERV
jgi:hypothetical protein